VDRAGAQAWLDSYVAAWLSYDADDIKALFTEDIAYRYHPLRRPNRRPGGCRRVVVGRIRLGWCLEP
jgi:hypothetical protein